MRIFGDSLQLGEAQATNVKGAVGEGLKACDESGHRLWSAQVLDPAGCAMCCSQRRLTLTLRGPNRLQS